MFDAIDAAIDSVHWKDTGTVFTFIGGLASLYLKTSRVERVLLPLDDEYRIGLRDVARRLRDRGR